MPSDADRKLRAPAREADPSLVALITTLRSSMGDSLNIERCMRLTGAGRADVVLALRVLERDTVPYGTGGGGEAQP